VWEAYLQKKPKTPKPAIFKMTNQFGVCEPYSAIFKRIINSVGHCINELFSLLDSKKGNQLKINQITYFPPKISFNNVGEKTPKS